MKRHIPFHRSMLVLALLLLSACLPNPPAAALPTQDSTMIAIAAEATVTAMASARTPGAAQPPAAAPSAPTEPSPAEQTPTMLPTTPAPAAQPADFWVTYIVKNKLHAINGDGTKKALLTNTPGMDYLPTWSPDGKLLAFIRFGGDNRTDGTLHLLPAGSNTPSVLDGSHEYSHFTWTADSRQILAVSNFTGAFDVSLLDVSSGQPAQVAKNVSEFPRLSPDGKQIALLINNGVSCSGKGCTMPNDLFLYDIATRKSTRLTSDALPKIAIAWSPDGAQLAYDLAVEGSSLVEIIQPDGKMVATRAALPWWRVNWLRSPDGSQIAYYVNDTSNGGVEIFVMPGSGSGEPRKVTRVEKSGDTMAYIDTLRWRPDGSGFVFNTWTGVHTVNLDGSGLRTLPVTLENVFFDVRPTTDSYTPAPDPTPPASWKLCPGAMESRLDVGRQAQVTTDPPTPNNVRQSPSRTARLVGQIQPGEKIEITGGPICNNGLIWWEIRSLASGLKGYTLEGDKQTYWLVPLQ